MVVVSPATAARLQMRRMAFVREPGRRGRLPARALLDLALGRPLRNLDLELDQELHEVLLLAHWHSVPPAADAGSTEEPLHRFDLIALPAAETTHQAPPKWTKPWPLRSPAFLSWAKK